MSKFHKNKSSMKFIEDFFNNDYNDYYLFDYFKSCEKPKNENLKLPNINDQAQVRKKINNHVPKNPAQIINNNRRSIFDYLLGKKKTSEDLTESLFNKEIKGNSESNRQKKENIIKKKKIIID